MRAAALRQGRIYVNEDVPEPEPGVGQVLVQVKACGICGSDLHFAKHGPKMVALGRQMKGVPDLGGVGDGGGDTGSDGDGGSEPSSRPELDFDADIWMGHEFAAEVLEAGPDTAAPPPGSLVTSIPVLVSGSGVRPIVYSNDVAAGYGERMLLSAPLLLQVPNGLDHRLAALTEPMAVGLHAVNRSGIAPGDGALVLGCGPVGLAVIAALRMRGVETVVAADLSPGRRAIATAMGATEVVDPAIEPAFDAWERSGGTEPPVVFEAIGVPGIIDDVLRDAPARARLVVVGVCMEPDRITPYFGIAKELSVQFCLGYDPTEFSGTLTAIAEGRLDVRPMITGEVPLEGVARAFDDLGTPDAHCKILVMP